MQHNILPWRQKDALVNIISPKNRLEFLMEKLLYKETLTLQLTKVSGEKADIIDKKNNNLPLYATKNPAVGKKRMQEKEIVETIMIREQKDNKHF